MASDESLNEWQARCYKLVDEKAELKQQFAQERQAHEQALQWGLHCAEQAAQRGHELGEKDVEIDFLKQQLAQAQTHAAHWEEEFHVCRNLLVKQEADARQQQDAPSKSVTRRGHYCKKCRKSQALRLMTLVNSSSNRSGLIRFVSTMFFARFAPS